VGPYECGPSPSHFHYFPLLFNQGEDFLEKEGEGHGYPSSPLLWWYNGGRWYGGPKFVGVEGDFLSNREEDFYGNVEWNDVESNGGDLENATNIKHVYCDNTWKLE
jgi:hypothetical protein